MERQFRWLQDIAQGAALMTRTKVSVQIDTDCHEIILNLPLAQRIVDNLKKVGPPKFSEEELVFARRLQEPLTAEFGTKFDKPLDDEVHRLPAEPPPSKGSTDVGDVSWRVPTGGLHVACFIYTGPGHSWQNVATIGSSIGEKGTLCAAKALAVTALDLLEEPELVAAAKADWKERMKDKKYFSFIPEGQKAPEKIR
ncbi:MAG: hypothetical protein HYS13_21020 [Planctomycetia bacterium]|nr:hypothetical protein [Planctomycetia bacterium]